MAYSTYCDIQQHIKQVWLNVTLHTPIRRFYLDSFLLASLVKNQQQGYLPLWCLQWSEVSEQCISSGTQACRTSTTCLIWLCYELKLTGGSSTWACLSLSTVELPISVKHFNLTCSVWHVHLSQVWKEPVFKADNVGHYQVFKQFWIWGDRNFKSSLPQWKLLKLKSRPSFLEEQVVHRPEGQLWNTVKIWAVLGPKSFSDKFDIDLGSSN